MTGFNTQPPEGGWGLSDYLKERIKNVSTHSRLKAAGCWSVSVFADSVVSTHSRLKAAGTAVRILIKAAVFQHTAA